MSTKNKLPKKIKTVNLFTETILKNIQTQNQCNQERENSTMQL